ncbi:MAG: lipopolysaccharide biosynthesis protein [Halobacteriaceae archaeon]
MTGDDGTDGDSQGEGLGRDGRGPSRQLNFARAGGLLVGAEVLNLFIGLGSTVYFAQTLGATLLGVFFLFEASLDTMTVVADFGVRGAVEKRISEGTDPRQVFAASVVLKVLLLAAVGAVVWAFRGVVNDYVGAEVAGLLVVTAVTFEFATLVVHVLRGELRADETAALQLLRLVTYVGVAVVLLQFGYGVRALIFGLIAGYVVMGAAGLLRISLTPARPQLRHFTTLTSYAKFNGVWALGGYVYNTMDILVIGLFLTQADVGAYALAWRVTTMTTLVGSVVSNTIFAQLSAWSSAGAHDRIRETLREATTSSLFLVVPALFGVAVLGREILGVAFGPEYVVAAGAFVVLMGEKVVSGVNLVFDAAVRAYDRPDVGAIATAASLTLNVVLNVAFVPTFGLVGAAVATTTAVVVHTVVLGGYLRHLVTIEFAVRDLAWCTVASVAMAAAILAVRQVVAVDDVVSLVGVVGFGGVVYLGLVLASGSLRGKVLANAREFLA